MLPVSVWESESFFAHRDIIIIGSGFTGLWSAYFIKKRFPKKKIYSYWSRVLFQAVRVVVTLALPVSAASLS